MASAGDGQGVVYTNWDKDSILMCDCDAGFFGADCSMVMCPKGDDPMTINQNYRTIRLTVTKTSGSFSGSLGFEFQGTTSYLPLTSPTAQNCAAALEASPQIGSVGCTVTYPSALTLQFTITFYSWPTNAKSNNLHYHDGNPLLREFLCDISRATSDISCAWGDVVSSNVIGACDAFLPQPPNAARNSHSHLSLFPPSHTTTEWEFCSNRGICDFNSGICACEDGFGGAACSNQTYSHSIPGSNALPGFQVNVAGTDFVGDALQIRTEKGPAPDFFLIEAIAGNQRVFDVRGDGVATFTGFITHNGGQTIASGGLMITTTGLTVAESGMTVKSSSTTTPVTVISSTAPASSTFSGDLGTSTGGVLTVNSLGGGSHNLLYAANSSTGVFKVSNTGLVSVKGGMAVSGGVSVYNAGLSVTGGFTVRADGVGATFGSPVTITSNSGLTTPKIIVGQQGLGLQVLSGGINVFSGGINIVSGGLRVKGVTVLQSTSIQTTQFTSSGGITAGSFTTAGAVTASGAISGASLSVGSGAITAGSLALSGGTISATGLSMVASGITTPAVTSTGTIAATGAITSSTTIAATGAISGASLSVGAGAITAGSLALSGGTISATGLSMTATGITTPAVTSTGTMSASGLSITSTAGITTPSLTISGTGTISATGLSMVASGITTPAVTSTGTIAAPGAISGASLSVGAGAITAGSLALSGGTISATGLSMTATGITTPAVTSTGTMSASGLSITSTGTISAYGLTVGAGGISFGGSTFTSATVATTTATADNFYLTTTSDRRLKRDLAPVGDSLDKLRRLKSVYFYWTPEAQRGLSGLRSGQLIPKDAPQGLRGTNDAASRNSSSSNSRSSSSSNSSATSFLDPLASAAALGRDSVRFDSRRHIGFIAQDVQGVIPEAVSEMHGDRYLGIDYAAVVPVLAGALQELDRIQAAQAAEIRALREEIQTMRQLQESHKKGALSA